MKKVSIIKSSPLARLEEIEEFENQNGIKLSNGIKKFLNNFNAVSIEETLFKKEEQEYWLSNFYPFDRNHEVSLQEIYKILNNRFFQNKYVAFASDSGGWKYVISVQKKDHGRVYLCRMDSELEDALTLLAESFEDFINGLQKVDS